MAQYKIKDTGELDGKVKFIICTKFWLSWTILKLEVQDGRVTLWEWMLEDPEKGSEWEIS